MPCVCGNGHIIRCAEVNRASRNVQKTILHLTALLTVHENAEALQLGIHVHACQRHTIPRLLLELAFVDPPAVDGRRTIDDASTDCEFRVGGQFRETNRGYGKLCSSNPHIHVAELFGEEPELLTRTVVPAVDPDVRAVFACLRVLDVEHESVFVCDCPIGFHPRAGKPYRLRRLTADQEYRRANRVDLVYGKLRGSDDESFPCPLQTSQHGQIGAEIVAGGCLDVAVTELSCDH